MKVSKQSLVVQFSFEPHCDSMNLLIMLILLEKILTTIQNDGEKSKVTFDLYCYIKAKLQLSS